MVTQSMLIGFSFVLLVLFIGYSVFKNVTICVDDESEVFLLSFGKIKKRWIEPGLHLDFEKLLPWNQEIHISKKTEFKIFKNIQLNDHYGTSVIIDLWVEFRITDTYKALFEVENWNDALESLVKHTTTSLLSTQTINQILRQRSELGDQLKDAMLCETERWGITLSGAMIQNVELLPEMLHQFFESVAAKIERTKALIQEKGRLKVMNLEAETSKQIAELNALSNAQLPLAIGKCYGRISENPRLLLAFQEYWELLNLNPKRTITLEGLGRESFNQLESIVSLENQLNH